MRHPDPVPTSSSAPRPGMPWHYRFYLNLVAQWDEACQAGSDEAVFFAFMISCCESQFPELGGLRQEEGN